MAALVVEQVLLFHNHDQAYIGDRESMVALFGAIQWCYGAGVTQEPARLAKESRGNAGIRLLHSEPKERKLGARMVVGTT